MTGPAKLARWRGDRSLKEAALLLLGDESKWWKYRRWERGERAPAVEDAVVIHRVTGVDVSSWSTAETVDPSASAEHRKAG